jgi:polyphosphate glucokinase
MIAEATGCKAHVLNDVDAAGMAEMSFGAGKGKQGTVLVATFGTGIGTTFFVDGKQLPNSELGHLKMHGTIAEKYCSNAIRKNKDLEWKEWGIRVNEYLNYLEHLFWPDLIIFGGGVCKHHYEFFRFLETRATLVPAAFLNNAGIVGAAIAAKVEGLTD